MRAQKALRVNYLSLSSDAKKREIVPHPGIQWPKAGEADYTMVDSSPWIKRRATLAGNVVRRWGIDSTDDHRLNLASHHLWLRNPQTLYGVESASLAPGRDAVQKGRQ